MNSSVTRPSLTHERHRPAPVVQPEDERSRVVPRSGAGQGEVHDVPVAGGGAEDHLEGVPGPRPAETRADADLPALHRPVRVQQRQRPLHHLVGVGDPARIPLPVVLHQVVERVGDAVPVLGDLHAFAHHTLRSTDTP